MGLSNKVADRDQKLKEKYESFGNAYQGEFKGPVANRSCTDVLCLILYLIFTLAGAAVVVFAFIRGNPALLVYPTDSDGKVCGVNEMDDRPYLYFFDLMDCIKSLHTLPFSGCPTTQVCVKECPQAYFTWVQFAGVEAQYGGHNAELRKQRLICTDNVDFDKDEWLKMSVLDLVKEGYCSPYLIPQTPVVNRCMPKFMVESIKGKNTAEQNYTIHDANGNKVSYQDLGAAKDAFRALLQLRAWGERILADIEESWPHILCLCIFALILSFAWILLLRFIAAVIVWTTIVLFILIWLFGLVFALWRYNLLTNIVDIPTPPGELAKFTAAISFQTTFESPALWLAVAIICGIILLVCLILLCFLGSRINLAVKLFEETSKALGHMPSTLLWPFIPFTVHLATIGWAAAAAVCLATLGRAEFVGRMPNSTYQGLIKLPDSITDCDYAWELQKVSNFSEGSVGKFQDTLNVNFISDEKSSSLASDAVSAINSTLSEVCRFLKYGAAEYAIYFHLFNIFMFFWHFNFITGVGIVTLAGAFGSYYWAFKKPDDIPKLPLLTGFCRAFRYHLGSVAFGSLLIALVQITRVILEYIMMKMKRSHNFVGAFIFRCLSCCFACLEQLVKFIARKAYIVVAVHGKNFCASAKEAWQLIMRNIIRAAVLTGVSRFLIIISVLIVTGATIVLAYFYFHGDIPAAIPVLVSTWPTLNYFYVPVIIVAIAAFAIATMCFFVYDIGVETMFICFLEDCERNDGSAQRPYYMSRNLASALR